MRHFVFDYAENSLLPKLQKQLGQLHFITGLKFDLFGFACSNDGKTDVYVLVEGFWPGEKTENIVLSILHHSINMRSGDTCNGKMGDRLVLHAHSFTGQNKNRFFLFYIVWRVTVVYEDEVVLQF